MHTFPGSFAGQTVTLTFDQYAFDRPDSVLVFAYRHGELLFTRNGKRGWELPGGKVEPGEFPVAAAVREVYEETGAELDALEPIGQYQVQAPDVPIMIKTVYVARFERLHARPSGFETDDVRLFAVPPDHNTIRRDTAYSVLLHDEIYPLVLAHLSTHPFTRMRTEQPEVHQESQRQAPIEVIQKAGNNQYAEKHRQRRPQTPK